jgi:hypothetical protein
LKKREGAYLQALASALSLLLLCFKHLFLTPISTLLFQASSFKLSFQAPLNFGIRLNTKWVEVGRRGKLWGKEESWKNLGQGKRMCFWFIPKTPWIASSWIGALVVVGSFQPMNLIPYWVGCWILHPFELGVCKCELVTQLIFLFKIIFCSWIEFIMKKYIQNSNFLTP